MDRKDYYAEGKYRCNHPESDFENTSTNPIEMKKENFTEYTHRNETSNMQYDVWGNSNNTTSLNNIDLSKYQSVNSSNMYAQNRTTNSYSAKNLYNTKKKSNGLGVFGIILFIYIGIPFIFGIISVVLSMLDDLF